MAKERSFQSRERSLGGCAPVKFPETWARRSSWQIQPGPGSEPDTLYCGVEPAALFVSRDAGQSWSLAEGLWNHPYRARWEPGAGGLCLHTVLVDPNGTKRTRIAVSAAGMYATEDGGAMAGVEQRGARPVPARQVPGARAVRTQGRAGRGAAGAHSDMFRCTQEGKLRVFRTRDAGASWEPLSNGLPQENAFETVLRDSLAADSLDPAGVYFGTRSGKVFGSNDEGQT